jgi:DnaK suppressor protein
MSADVAMSSLRINRTHPAISSPHWRALLEARWRASLERVTELSLAYYDAEEAGTRAADGRPAGGRQSRSLLSQAVAERRALAEIEAALTRLANGSFGRCERCHGSVSAARLARIPQARSCWACDGEPVSASQAAC